MRARTVLVFGLGYLVGTRAGRERWEQINDFRRRMADLLEEQVADRETAEDQPTWASNGEAARATR